MASFSLRSQRTGRYKSFTLLEVLKLLGDAVNDEIWLEDGEDVYNLSSFREIGGSEAGGITENWSVEEIKGQPGRDTFYLRYLPADTTRLSVLFNGIDLHTSDYTLDGQEVSLPFRLNPEDSLKFSYPY